MGEPNADYPGRRGRGTALTGEQGYQAAKEYYTARGDLNVPTTYVCTDGFRLGKWLSRHREGSIRVTPERRSKLDALGMVWEKPDPWWTRYGLAKQYYEIHGNLDMPAQYVVDGIWMQKWLYIQRNIYQGKVPNKQLTKEQIKALDAISMDWDGRPKRLTWEESYQAVKSFYAEHGHLRFPTTTKEYRNMSQWLRRQEKRRQENKLTRVQEEKLDALMMPDSLAEKHIENKRKVVERDRSCIGKQKTVR